MFIQIMHLDNRFDYVKENMLDVLIESNQIASFKRSSGWVVLGVDPVRRINREDRSVYSNEIRSILTH